jgi:hypothetical protein
MAALNFRAWAGSDSFTVFGLMIAVMKLLRVAGSGRAQVESVGCGEERQ